MDAATSRPPHPTDQTLQDYGLGKLDDLLAKAVHAHLEGCPDCRRRVAEISSDSFLSRLRDAQAATADRSAHGGPQGTLTDHEPVNPTPAAFLALTLPPGLADHPDYEVLRELGRGGMGVVYLAHNRLMGRKEVLKVMGQRVVGHPEALDRFLREIRAVASLRHPNIVSAYHATRLGESIVFAMEYVEGLDLAKMVKAKGPMPVSHACHFVHQAALGLQHAHEEGMVHRDIKPGNLMLSRKGDKAVVKVLDFGLARASREGKFDGDLTGAGQMLGTPAFMAPEQFRDAQKADIRADIYSLGCTLYYLLTGHPPFQGTSLYDLFQAHHSTDPPLLNRERPDVPVELAALVAKLMAKQPDDRFQTPAEVAKALTPFFKKGSAAFKTPNLELSQVGTTTVGQPAPGAVSTPTQTATDTGKSVAHPGKAAEPSMPEARRENLIEIRQTESPEEAAPSIEPTRRPPWVWPSVAVGVLVLGLFAAWLAGGLRVRTPEGDLVFDGLPDESVVTLDGKVYTVEWPGDGGPAKVSVPAGDHRLKVELKGVTVCGEDVMVEAGKKKWIRVRWEPRVATRKNSAGGVGGSPTSEGEAGNSPVGKPPVPPARITVIPKDGGMSDRGASPGRVADGPAGALDSTVLPKQIVNSIGMKLVLIPAGEFLMGSPGSDPSADSDEKPQHRVRISKPFYLGINEVTQGNFRAVMGRNPSYFKGSDDLPVEQVTWLAALRFCIKLSELENRTPFYRVDGTAVTIVGGDGYRLPTEAEWEYACRAGSTTRYPFLEGAGVMGEYVWYRRNSEGKTHPVGQKLPNAWGLYDMLGNVLEWCGDWYGETYYASSPGSDPSGPPSASTRVDRGGSWTSVPPFCRSADRAGFAPGERNNYLGFRVALVQSGR
jgi:formylglycine-generating enzyme required for sulfatase activity/serine/threonine protein kinase